MTIERAQNARIRPFPVNVRAQHNVLLIEDNPGDARLMQEYLSEPAQQVAFHRLTGDLPARRAAWVAAALQSTRHAQAFWIQLQHVRSTPKIPEWERIADLIARHGEAAVRGDMTLDDALATLDHDVDAVLEKRRWLVDHGG